MEISHRGTVYKERESFARFPYYNQSRSVFFFSLHKRVAHGQRMQGMRPVTAVRGVIRRPCYKI